MNDEKPKPFARAEPYAGPSGRGFRVPEGMGTHAVIIDTPDGDRCVWPGTEPYARNSADRLNAAVEAREAKLRGVLERLVRYGTTNDYDGAPMCGFCERRLDTDPILQADHLNGCGGAALAEEARAALGPNPPAYVPKSQLDEANATIAKMRAAFDALDVAQYGAHGPTVAEFLVEAGFKKPESPTVNIDAANAAPLAASSRYLLWRSPDGRLFVKDTADPVAPIRFHSYEQRGDYPEANSCARCGRPRESDAHAAL